MIQPLAVSRSVLDAVGRCKVVLRWLPAALQVFLFTWIFLANIILPDHIAATELDPSWEQTVHSGFVQGLQWGLDLVATRGPLGIFDTREYHRQTYALLLVWYAVTSAGLAAVGLLYWRQDVSLPTRGAFLGLMLLAPLLPGYEETRPMLLLCGGAFLLLRSVKPSLFGLLLLAAFIGVLSLVKATYLASGLVVLGLLLFHIVQVRGTRVASLMLVTALLVCQLAWTAAGQKPQNWIPFLRTNLLVIGGYNQALHLEVPNPALAAAAAAYLILLGTSARALRHWPAGSARVAAWILVAGIGFQSFKLGFGRYDEIHWNRTFLSWSSLALMVWQLSPGAGRAHAGFGILLAVSLYALTPESHARRWELLNHGVERLSSNAEALLGIEAFRERMEAQRASLQEQYRLPRIAATVGTASVDLFTYQQGLLLLNDLNYRPRPIRQSHMAYSPELAALNHRHMIGPRAPDYVLLRWETIDDRLPTMDDGIVLLELLRRYQPLFEENQVLLMRRRDLVLEPLRVVRTAGTVVGFDEEVAVPEAGTSCQAFTVQLTATPAGRLRSTLVQGPHVFMEVDFQDGSTQRYRIVPGMLRQPVLLDPLPDTSDRMQRFIQTGVCDRIPCQLRFSTCQPRSLEPAVRVTFFALPDLPRRTVEPNGSQP